MRQFSRAFRSPLAPPFPPPHLPVPHRLRMFRILLLFRLSFLIQLLLLFFLLLLLLFPSSCFYFKTYATLPLFIISHLLHFPSALALRCSVVVRVVMQGSVRSFVFKPRSPREATNGCLLSGLAAYASLLAGCR